MFSFAEKRYLLLLARRAIECRLFGEEMELEENLVPSSFKIKKGVFVTLTINDKLRGCMGNIEPNKELWQAVIKNAQSAAFDDDRFEVLIEDEFAQMEIEISILDIPKKYDYDSVDQLLDYLQKNKPGVVLEKKDHGATFLPQVWEDIIEVKDFLSQLCLKAGLGIDEWRDGKCLVKIYQVEKFRENE